MVDSVPSSTLVIGSLAPTRVDLLPPRKRFRDSYSSEASIEEDIEIDPIETEVDVKLGIGDGDDFRDHVEIDPRDVRDNTEGYEADTIAGDTVEVGIDPMSAPIVEEEIVEPAREDSSDSSGTRDGIVRSFEDMPIDLDDVVRDFYHHMSKIRIDRIVGIETVQRWLEADQLIARGQRVSMIERIERELEEFRQVRKDRDDTRGRLRRTMTITRSSMTFEAIRGELVNPTSVTEQRWMLMRRPVLPMLSETENLKPNMALIGDNGNGGNGNGRNENPDQYVRGDRPVARECTYQDFMKCQPLNFNGTEGVVGLIRCALTWVELNIKNEIQKMETELWNLTMKNNDLTAYTQRFQELTMITYKTIRCCSDCQLLDGSKVEGLCCKKRREQEEIEQ
ncbi:hypothetical protein Tco_0026229 [Tanacetum coccineum]